jgi:hypothetical protein
MPCSPTIRKRCASTLARVEIVGIDLRVQIATRALLMSRGKRFESARRLSVFSCKVHRNTIIVRRMIEDLAAIG